MKSLKNRVFGQDHPYTGHFDIVQSDGSIIPVESKKQNCLYHAIVQATDKGQGDPIHERVTKLRGDVQKEVSQKCWRVPLMTDFIDILIIK